jgi:hypothetical protein
VPDASISRDILPPAQSAALRYVEDTTRPKEATALQFIAGMFERAGYGLDNYNEVIELIRQHARIVLHFHPDRFGHSKSATVAEALLAEGVYRNQFETGLSSGSPTAIQAASATPGSAGCLAARITPKAYWLRSAPNTEPSNLFGSPTARHRGLDHAISCSEV